jgi:tetratricopeptide (TPR) repeat protein
MAAGSPGLHPHPHPHPPGNAELARFLADRGVELDRALAEAKAAAEQSKSVAVTDTLAWCLYKTGDYARAKQVALEALRWRTPDANVLFHAGMIHAAAGDRPAAQRYLYQALSLNPAFHPVHASVAAEKLREWGAPPAPANPESSLEASVPDSTARLP